MHHWFPRTTYRLQCGKFHEIALENLSFRPADHFRSLRLHEVGITDWSPDLRRSLGGVVSSDVCARL
jgi:hypothetical protein